MNLFDQATSIDGSGAGSIPGSVGSVFAQGTDVFGQTIPNWAFIAAGAVLVAVIIVMLVVLAQKARRKKRPGNPGGGMNSASRRPQAAAPARPVPEKMAPAAPPAGRTAWRFGEGLRKAAIKRMPDGRSADDCQRNKNQEGNAGPQPGR